MSRTAANIAQILRKGDFSKAKVYVGIMKSNFILNHVGYRSNATKNLIYTGNADSFQVMRLQDLKLTPVFTGDLCPVSAPDFSTNKKQGDFSALTEPGIYRISAGGANSRCFLIGDSVYNTVERMLTSYFTWQRCGDRLGWNGCCHGGDRIVLQNGEERSLAGGHHQSSDLRKWVFGTSLGMLGYVEYALTSNPVWDNGLFDEEIRHSLKYYFNLISDEGYVYDGTWVFEGYKNECRGVGFNDYDKLWERRQYFESPAPEPGQWQSVRMFALCARYYREKDPSLSARCLAAAKKIYAYMQTHDLPDYDLPLYPPLGHDGMAGFYTGFYKGSALRLGSKAIAAIELYKAQADETLQSDAASCLCELSKLRVGGEDLCSACFWEGARSKRLANNYYYFFTTSVPFAYLEAAELWSEHEDARTWRRTVEDIAKSNASVCLNNAYNRVAATWHTVGHAAYEMPGCFSFAMSVKPKSTCGEAGTAERDGEAFTIRYEYESFCYNLDVIALGIFFSRASALLNDKTYMEYAERQLDWIMGYNRFDASNVEGVGYNQPHRGLFGEFYPPVPQIPGGVFVGFTDGSFDEESFGFENEYDMPMVGWLMQLLSELGRNKEA